MLIGGDVTRAVNREVTLVDTAAKVAERVKKWSTTFLYFALVPTVLLALAATFWIGKSFLTLHDIANNSKRTVEDVLKQAKRPTLLPPCILYFDPNLRTQAVKARDLVKTVQNIPDTRILYSDPKVLTSDQRELLDLSHIDIVIVLGQP